MIELAAAFGAGVLAGSLVVALFAGRRRIHAELTVNGDHPPRDES